MRADARIVATYRHGRTQVTELRSAPPLLLRRTGPTEVSIVSSAASPVGGDRVCLDLAVRNGARLTVRTVAATIVYPSPSGSTSTFDLTADVAVDASLAWVPEPMVLVEGSRHITTARVLLDAGASLRWHDVVRLGRWRQQSGSLLQRTSIDRDGTALLRHDLAVGPAWPAWRSSATFSRFTVVGSAVHVGPPAPPSSARRTDTLEWAVHPLADDAAAWSALGERVDDVRGVLGRTPTVGDTAPDVMTRR